MEKYKNQNFCLKNNQKIKIQKSELWKNTEIKENTRIYLKYQNFNKSEFNFLPVYSCHEFWYSAGIQH